MLWSSVTGTGRPFSSRGPIRVWLIARSPLSDGGPDQYGRLGSGDVAVCRPGRFRTAPGVFQVRWHPAPAFLQQSQVEVGPFFRRISFSGLVTGANGKVGDFKQVFFAPYRQFEFL